MAKPLKTAEEYGKASPLEQVILNPRTGRVSAMRVYTSALALALATGLAGEVADEFKEAMYPTFPSDLSAEDVGVLTAHSVKAHELCEGPNGNPMALKSWVPTRDIQIANLGVTPESYHFCRGLGGTRGFKLVADRVGFKDEFFSNPWILEDVHQVDTDTGLTRFGIDTVFNGHVDHWAVARPKNAVASTEEITSVNEVPSDLLRK